MIKIKLADIDTSPSSKFKKEQVKEELKELKERFEELQNLLYAEGKHALLVILQGMDASGKDGAIRNVFGALNPQGCNITSFKAPTHEEMKHDFLWRIHQQVPEFGMIGVFNRSHYEDVIIQRVHKWVNEKIIQQRYEHINNFEKLMNESGITVVKFYLHVSKKEQSKRLEERIHNPAKMWKYNKDDFKERKFWNDYMKAYEKVFENCSVHSPWNIVPADHNWYKEYFIAKKIVETLEGFKMKFPTLKKK